MSVDCFGWLLYEGISSLSQATRKRSTKRSSEFHTFPMNNRLVYVYKSAAVGLLVFNQNKESMMISLRSGLALLLALAFIPDGSCIDSTQAAQAKQALINAGINAASSSSNPAVSMIVRRELGPSWSIFYFAVDSTYLLKLRPCAHCIDSIMLLYPYSSLQLDKLERQWMLGCNQAPPIKSKVCMYIHRSLAPAVYIGLVSSKQVEIIFL